VRLVTGDTLVTATAISKKCGILPEDYIQENDYEGTTGPVVHARGGGIQNPGAGEAEVVSNLEEFKKYRTHLKVLARSRPEDKYLLATGLR
jgi:Ca2+ transporting ATPase